MLRRHFGLGFLLAHVAHDGCTASDMATDSVPDSVRIDSGGRAERLVHKYGGVNQRVREFETLGSGGDRNA